MPRAPIDRRGQRRERQRLRDSGEQRLLRPIDKNNIVGSKQCGFENPFMPFLVATNNYWGAATGPGPNPADEICNGPGNTTLATPFATKPFIVNAPINP